MQGHKKKSCRRPMPSIRFRPISFIRIMSRWEASASARKAWSSAGRRGLRFGVGAFGCGFKQKLFWGE